MAKFLTWLFGLFLAAYLVALALFLVGTFGPDGGPLAGVFLIPLGFPWFMLADFAGGEASAWIAALAPLVNLAIIWVARRIAMRARTAGET